MAAYHRRLVGDDPAVQLTAAQAWSQWEARTLTQRPSAALAEQFSGDAFALAFARIENHYCVHGGFFEDGQLLRDAHRLADIPGVIAQGRYDVATPARTAWELHKAWPRAEFHMVADAGHAWTEPGILQALLAATDQFGHRGTT